MKKLILLTCCAIMLLTGCLPKEEPEPEPEITYPETLTENVVTLDNNVQLTVKETDKISSNVGTVDALVYCDDEYLTSYSVYVMLTNDISIFDIYQRMSGAEVREASGWQILQSDDSVIAGKKLDNYFCLLQSMSLTESDLINHLPEVENAL